MKDISGIRKEIDAIDEKLVGLLNKRASLAQKIAAIKKKSGSPVFIPARENEILKRVGQLNGGPLSPEALRGVFREIFSATRSVEKEIKVACLGPAGTFSHLAAIRLFGSSSSYSLEPGIDSVFKNVEKSTCDFGVVPIENTIEGAIGQTMELLIESQVNIFGELYLDVHHNLLSPAGDMRAVKTLYTHYMPLAQCRKWVAMNLPKVKVIETASSSEAAVKAKKDKNGAAIGSVEAAAIYGLDVLAEKLEDMPGNQTRFFVISLDKAPRSGTDKTSIVFSIKDSVGALNKILKPFAAKKINLSKIQSRPRKLAGWEYVFFIDFDGHMDDADVKWTLSKMKGQTTFFKSLGSYPNAKA
ncbi:MAG: prephenate dehydratase [Nitrospinae bacterium]|nr:prephenate dehydratase [Nitrospinota bacterium]